MRGIHNLTIQSAHLKYEMSFARNITVIQGDSATGKTTLVDMVQPSDPRWEEYIR